MERTSIEGRLLSRRKTDVKFQDELLIDCKGAPIFLIIDRRTLADQFSFMNLARRTYFDKMNVQFFYEGHMLKCDENVYSVINKDFDRWGLKIE